MSHKSNRRTSGMQIDLPDALEKIVPWPQSNPSIGCPLDDSGTQRIVGAVGARFVPQGLKLEALRDDLVGCYIRWDSLTQLTSNKLARERFQRFHAIAKRAKSLLKLLDNGLIGGWVRAEIAMTFPLKEGAPVRKTTAEFRTDQGQPDPAPSFYGLLAGLHRLAESARYKAAYFSDFALYRLSRSPLEYFVANVLPSVFESHFERPGGASRVEKGTKTGGPYIRFAAATLKELGITNNGKPYAPETVARALSGVRSGRVRRRKKG
jgi:hypothetical protein